MDETEEEPKVARKRDLRKFGKQLTVGVFVVVALAFPYGWSVASDSTTSLLTGYVEGLLRMGGLLLLLAALYLVLWSGRELFMQVFSE